ncbi:N-acylethanolamine-hydrolyzing acid amidase-like [Oopsacas minuta]|uniref:N-acylethanolamine-hydrolyzing acid amidase n=1 Tax=Oopsacas minuta TaxID=111878 RepID=A0AAV7K671_9METZ|nr:N-acylethanolamine-hydrolyzing acid amidase-like [Oopsacas minuta]
MHWSTVFSFVCVSSILFGISSCHTPPTYTINLDEAPKLRWKEVAKDYGTQMVNFRSKMVQLLKIPVALLDVLETQAPAILAHLPNEYAGEIVGLAQAIGLPLTDMILVNIIYDMTAACTSIVAQTTDDKIIHARNLDYSLPMELRNLTIIVDVQRNNLTVFNGVTFAGMIGLATGQKPNRFTISLNQRNKGFRLENLYEMLLNREAHFVTLYIRGELESDESEFNSAVENFQIAPFMAPCYIILGGVKPGEGAVITRGREAELDVRFIDKGKGAWYVLETNYDWWEPPPSSDNRRDPAVKHMKDVGRSKISLDTLYEVLSTPPVCNNGTTYTAMMSAGKPDEFRAVIRDKDTPCK